jgi:hypothetical protein
MRQLLPFVFLGHFPVGWKCSRCGQVFRLVIKAPNPREVSSTEPTDNIKAEFLSHECQCYWQQVKATTDSS